MSERERQTDRQGGGGGGGGVTKWGPRKNVRGSKINKLAWSMKLVLLEASRSLLIVNMG